MGTVPHPIFKLCPNSAFVISPDAFKGVQTKAGDCIAAFPVCRGLVSSAG